MSKWLVIVLFLALGFICTPAFAQTTPESTAAAVPLIPGLALVGAGLIVLGVGFGIGRIGGSACESIARQPEMAGKIQTAMIIAAALIEGAAFFALLLVLIV
jgi:F-type H+-transporting ATPase subunit c